MMRKKVLVVVCLLSSLLLSYVYIKADNHNLNASANIYNV